MHFLVPTDFSEPAQAALEYAVALNREIKGQITLLHVTFTKKITESLIGLDAIEHLAQVMDGPASSSSYVNTTDFSELKKTAHQKLEKCIDPSWSETIGIETAFGEGRPSVKIVNYAREHNVDMIVMGTHGRGAVSRFFLGSVTENVIQSADCPVLAVRGKKSTGS